MEERSLDTSSKIDLFLASEILPLEVQKAINLFKRDKDVLLECRMLESRLKSYEFSFEYYSNGIPFNLASDDPHIQKELESRACQILPLKHVLKYSYPKLEVEFLGIDHSVEVKTMDIVENIANSKCIDDSIKVDMLVMIHPEIRNKYTHCEEPIISRHIKRDELTVYSNISIFSEVKPS